MVLWNMVFGVFIPYGILLLISKLIGVFIVVTSLTLLCIWWYAVFKSIFEKNVHTCHCMKCTFNIRCRIWIRANCVIYAYFIISTYTYVSIWLFKNYNEWCLLATPGGKYSRRSCSINLRRIDIKHTVSKKSVVLFISCDNYRYYFKFI